MKYIPLKMVRTDLLSIPQYPLPPEFQFKLFTPGDEHHWADIETRVDEFKNEQAALERFNREFSPHLDDMEKRCLFIMNKHGEFIATATAWYGDLNGDGHISGRIHWVGIVPEYQGRKLAKPLLSAAMNILAQYHSEAYLTSQTTSYQAINMYLDYGFEPYRAAPTCNEAWTLMEKTLNRRIFEDSKNPNDKNS